MAKRKIGKNEVPALVRTYTETKSYGAVPATARLCLEIKKTKKQEIINIELPTQYGVMVDVEIKRSDLERLFKRGIR